MILFKLDTKENLQSHLKVDGIIYYILILSVEYDKFLFH